MNMATNMPSTSSDTSRRNEISDDELSKFSNHHAKTGCSGELKIYKDKQGIKGIFCYSCKREWLQEFPDVNVVPDSNFKPVAHHFVPTFCCLQVSDTGHYVQWRDIGKLKRGDHVAWRRLLSYWHHGIVTEDVKEGADELPVIEYSKVKRCTIRIKKETKNKGDVTGCCCCCCSQMYKVVYPKEVEDQNPPDLVMLRANAVKELGHSYNLFFHNCEHFATFCKTGSHKCNQLFQYKASTGAWIFRLLVAFLHIVVVVFLSETIEFLIPTIDEDYLAVLIILAFELLYVVIIIVITFLHDTHREEFKRKGKKQDKKKDRGNDESNVRRSSTSAFRRVVAKSVSQFFIFMFFVFIFGMVFVRLIGRWRANYIEQWGVKKRIFIEMSLGCLGGIIGSMVGYFVCDYIPWCCCHTNIGKDKDTETGTVDVEGAQSDQLSQTLPADGSNESEGSAEGGENIALSPREVEEEEREIIMPYVHSVTVNENIETQTSAL